MSGTVGCRFAAVLLMLGPGVSATAAEFIGAETCKACHPTAYAIWRASAHARAQGPVPGAVPDARCAACHAPDGGRPSQGVGCEACHGPGQHYAHRHVMRDRELARALGLQEVGEKTCLRCHDEGAPGLVRFDYARKSPLILHGEADRAARRSSVP